MWFKKQLERFVQYIFFGAVLTIALTSPATAGWQMEWIDNFDGTRVNKDNWTSQVQANYNAELQCYTDDDTSANKNYDVSGGTLKIISRRRANSCAGLGGISKSWTSGRLNSKDKKEFLYGRIESRIRIHSLKGGSWPAFWMLENRINEDPIANDGDNAAWPNPGAGEIDVWEWYANNPHSYITNFFNAAKSRPNYQGECGNEVRHPYPNGSADALQWHTYAMEWDENAIKFYMDDLLVSSQNISGCAQYKEPMFVLLNVAMGGTLGGAIDSSLNSATMEIDYVAHCSATDANNNTRCNQNPPVTDTAGAPVITSTALTSLISGNTYDYTLTATGLDALTMTAIALPNWLTFDSSTGRLSGTPAASDAGLHPVTLSVSDGTQSTEQSFAITVYVTGSTISDSGGGGSLGLLLMMLLGGLLIVRPAVSKQAK